MPEATDQSLGFWQFIAEVFQQHGAVGIALCFVCFLFWRMIWKVWDRAMSEKQKEIERLVKERDKYQALVFERLMSSGVAPDGKPAVHSQKKKP